MDDFTKHRHPVLAVPCPDCRKAGGIWCMRPSGHRASEFHRARCDAADQAFIDQHGSDASIERTGTGWQIDPTGRAAQNRAERDRPQQMVLICWDALSLPDARNARHVVKYCRMGCCGCAPDRLSPTVSAAPPCA